MSPPPRLPGSSGSRPLPKRAAHGIVRRAARSCPFVGGIAGLPSSKVIVAGSSRQMLRHDRAHCLACLSILVLGDEAQVPAREGSGRDDVVLTRGGAGDFRGVVGDVGAADDNRRIERQILLAGKLLTKLVQDSRRFVNGAVAGARREDPRRVGLAPRDGQLPATESSARDGAFARVFLEAERDVAALGGVDERFA